jgi:hypothetical protein
MKFWLLSLLTVAWTAFFYVNLDAQSDISVAGGNGQSSDGSFSYTVGQSFYSNFSDESGSFNEGVQQPEEFFIISSLPRIISRSTIQVYPNPFSTELFIRDEHPDIGKKYEIVNLTGQIIKSGNLLQATSIDVSSLSSGLFVLRIFRDFEPSIQFVIIKN